MAAAEDVSSLPGEYYASHMNRHARGVCEVWLASAAESVLEHLHAMHPGVYLIHNDAPRSLLEVVEIIERIDFRSLQAAGIAIFEKGPDPDGYVRVLVSSDAAGAQAKLDEMFGPNLIRVYEQSRPVACTPSIAAAAGS